ncbi:MAG: hypothetical protein GY757_52490 [bacterium]|nr:hypothetical protein [bacterium]
MNSEKQTIDTRASRFRLKNLSLPTILLEATFIMFAVLFALAVDQWNEARANEELAQKAFSRIKKELKENNAKLKELKKDHLELLKHSEEIVVAIEKRKGKSLDGSGIELKFNFTVNVLVDAAWQTAIFTQAIKHMEFYPIQKLASIYKLQQLYSELVRDIILNLNFPGIQSGNDEMLRALRRSIFNLKKVINLEDGLLKESGAFLKEYEKEKESKK